ncbi:Rieske 2Fe-2S domain-containing protein [Pseudomonas sp. MMS21-TM103]|uniref:Rieske (2Fe-2S) protein n=1 Tax=Pseudomonas sp. MMS21 TM103 TaxID=2886506 RepID=UPI001EDD4373|nr:Rieske 2Fe-2S domain-containing protein [Pseudomonas sp. MMS21 TM103]MCG4454912.1 Rieske 2Fe-2S domain-containing protein [Pseudomonas sp. MMS21 TM103]
MSFPEETMWVCHVSDIPTGTSFGVRFADFGSDDIFFVNNGEGIYAYRNSCPHWPGSTLPLKKNQYLDSVGEYIICRGHGAVFEIDTGLCIKGACVGQSLTQVDIKVGELGDIFVFGNKL